MGGKRARLDMERLRASRDSMKLVVAMLAGFIIVAGFVGAVLGNTVKTSLEPDILRGKVVVFFWSQTCPHCLQVLQVWEELEKQQPLEDMGIRLADISLQSPSGPQLFQRYGVFKTPTLAYLDNGRLLAMAPGPEATDPEGVLDAVKRLVRLAGIGEGGQVGTKPSTAAAFAGAGVAGLFAMFLGLGFLAALSPCSIAVLAAYAVSGRRLNPVACFGAGFTGTLLLAGFVAVLAAMFSSFLTLLPILLAAVVFYAGLVTLLGAGHAVGPGLRIPQSLVCLAYPFIAIQCSLPIVVAGFAGVGAVGSIPAALGFAIGMATPLALAALSSKAVNRLVSKLESRRGEIVSGLLLIVASLVIIASWVWGA